MVRISETTSPSKTIEPGRLLLRIPTTKSYKLRGTSFDAAPKTEINKLVNSLLKFLGRVYGPLTKKIV